MNKSELIDHIAAEAEISKSAAGRALDAVVDGIVQALKQESSVTLVGFGTFYVAERKPRTGRNPRTKETIDIEGGKVARFRPGKGLKEVLG